MVRFCHAYRPALGLGGGARGDAEQGVGAAAPADPVGVEELEHRAVDPERRSWWLAAGSIALAVGGGAGVVQLLRGLIGG